MRPSRSCGTAPKGQSGYCAAEEAISAASDLVRRCSEIPNGICRGWEMENRVVRRRGRRPRNECKAFFQGTRQNQRRLQPVSRSFGVFCLARGQSGPVNCGPRPASSVHHAVLDLGLALVSLLLTPTSPTWKQLIAGWDRVWTTPTAQQSFGDRIRSYQSPSAGQRR